MPQPGRSFMMPDPLEQAEIDNATVKAHKELMEKLREENNPEMRCLDAMELLYRIKYQDWRLSREIAWIQGQAVAKAIRDWSESSAFAEMVSGYVAPKTDEERVAILAKVASDAILAENRKHYDEIQSAIKETEKWKLTDKEVEELLK